MNDIERKYFSALHADRSESADTLEKPSMRGIKNSVVEKYSDQAHFIYELLQNADDAKATNVRLILEHDRLIFAHNGTRRFSVSNPETEDYDSEHGKLGDVNAITSIANSNKTEASIGKFGVGFKAVFQYTSTPHIYDPNFRFRIDRFIVPTLLKDDCPARNPDETLFVFPFDHEERRADEAYSDIADKMQHLSFPLLFLSQLKNIEFKFGNTLGTYGKSTERYLRFGITSAEKIWLTHNNGRESEDHRLWLFSREDECHRKYSVGFFLDDEGKLCPVNESAFCFFPTKEVTGLNFIIHAPFLLTDSREGIRAGVAHNDHMLKMLADLSADALEYLKEIGAEERIKLIDDNILSIIPVDDSIFSSPDEKRKVSFLPFYDAIKEKMSSSALLPTATGYTTTENAYWAAVPQLTQLFGESQLQDIVENPNARWVFQTMGRNDIQSSNRALFNYIEGLVKTNLNEDVILKGRNKDFYYFMKGSRQQLVNIKGISSWFIEKQSVAWLHEFYKWLSETKHRTEIVTDKPIFLNQDRKASAAYDSNNQLVLFLPVANMPGYNCVHEDLLKNEETMAFIKAIGITEPSLKSQIYTKIIPLYNGSVNFDTLPHFKLFFQYYCECSISETLSYTSFIKGYPFLNYYCNSDSNIGHASAGTMYLPTPELEAFLESKPNARFIDLNTYKELVGPRKEKELLMFLNDLGIKKGIQVITETITPDFNSRPDLPKPYSTRQIEWTENIIDGCREIIHSIIESADKKKSVILWNALLTLINIRCNDSYEISSLIRGTCKYFYYNTQREYFESSDAILLRSSKWMLDINDQFVSPSQVSKTTLSKSFDTSSPAAKKLLEFLGVPDSCTNLENQNDESNLTDWQKEKISMARQIEKLGFGIDDIAEFMEYQRRKIGQEKPQSQTAEPAVESPIPSDIPAEIANPEKAGYDKIDDIDTLQTSKGKLDARRSSIIKDIVQKTKRTQTVSVPELPQIDIDADEFIPASVDYAKQIERAKQKSAAEIDRIAQFDELETRAKGYKPYTFGWFRTLLEMECLNSGEANSNSKKVSIAFAKVEREPGTKRTLILKQPNHYIPQFMEDLADIPLVLHFGDRTKTVPIEVVSIKSYTLRTKLKSAADIADLDLSLVTEATIDAQSPSFLLKELLNQYEQFEYQDDFDMRENLCENIEFIFGPPGTGKTTYLARNVLIPMMQTEPECKVLVLTPTNKSADVLVRRIMEILGDDMSYKDWLIRFGITGDEDVEDSDVYKDKTFDIRKPKKSITVTTIARFPYDFFMPNGARLFLNGINWDYIVIDEASMIPIANIVYPLYKKTPRKFIIAGDPLQIQPITTVEHWKNENIYTMVNLDRFVGFTTYPHKFDVHLLTTQYRSIPAVGKIFSDFTYNGILNHYRKPESQKRINLGTDGLMHTLNILKFPTSKYESIYRPKRLQHSSAYQIYSALFTFEYISYLGKVIAENNPGLHVSIGVISPYRAQADMIEKLLVSERLPDQIEVSAGTIHGFQGDECDIIFTVFNTPPTISASKNLFLNNKNILNVSISRAKDYLFLVMPDDDTENIDNLYLIKKLEALLKQGDDCCEIQTASLESHMFGDSHYLENNSFSTSHQSVNVYGLPEMRYEIRAEDSAVDVQIHKEAPVMSTAAPPAALFVPAEVPEKHIQSVQGNNDKIQVTVTGRRAGTYELILYKEKLKDVTSQKTTSMYIPHEHSGQRQLVNVSVDEKAHTIYISEKTYRDYGHTLFSSSFELLSSLERLLPSFLVSPSNEGQAAKHETHPEKNRVPVTDYPFTTSTPTGSSKTELLDFIKQNSLTYVDNRDKGGALWIIGGPELENVILKCHDETGLWFRYKAGGGHATKGKNGWWFKP